MHWEQTKSYLSLALVGVLLSACDAVVPSSYRGESRFRLGVSVLNNTTDQAEEVVPALAHVDDARVLFRAVDYSRSFTNFRLDVYDAPSEDQRAPVDPFLAPNVLVAREYIGAVLKSRIGRPISLNAKPAPLHPDCWNGGCDYLPGQMTEPCAEDDEECLERQRDCPNGACEIVASGSVLPDGVEDVTGFAAEYVLLFMPEAVKARSWAALKLGAPDGLKAGYQLAKRVEPSGEASVAAGECLEGAFSDVFERFNEAHDTTYNQLTLSCMNGTLPDIACEGVEFPEGDARRELAAALAAEEVDRGCLELAPDVELIRDPEQESISVQINGEPPDWFPTIPFTLAHVAGQEEVMCEGASVDAGMDEMLKPSPVVRMTGYSGTLCPEDSLVFSESEGAFSVSSVSETMGEQRCELSFVLTTPAGYRFRKPIFFLQGYAGREDASVRPTLVTMTYTMAGEPMSSQHVVSGTLDFGDYFTLVDTPNLSVPECNSECASVDLDLKVEIVIDTPDRAYTSFYGIEAELEYGVEWTTCGRDFSER